MPRELGDRYVFVNVPAYQMQVMEGEKTVLAMRVIVGDPKHQTPLFSDEMTTIVFSPNWNVA
jgi:murein L,D-transpeptidase YcbB/YkuD